ncbi:MAG: hypothetical protein ACI82Q_001306 [Nonlabens sp.]|jgi:hypothetical protein
MNISKILLWVANVLIVGITILLISLIVIQQFFLPSFKTDDPSKFDGVVSMSWIRSSNTSFYDLEYLLIYRDGETIVDNHLISPNHFKRKIDYSKASKADFLKVQTSEGVVFTPGLSERVYLPLDDDQVSFYFRMTTAIYIVTWIFFFFQLVWIRRLIKNFTQGNFFQNINVRLLMKFSYIYIALPVVIALFKGFLNLRLIPEELILPNGHEFVVDNAGFQFQYLFVGLMIMLIAQAFRQGTKLQEEQALTV